jgi:serine/threonine protein kinase
MDSSTAPGPSTEVNALADRLVAEMRRRWDRGERPRTEDFLSEHPELRDHPGAAGELIYEEVSLRREGGEPGGSAEVLARFPQWATQLRLLLDLRDALDVDREPLFPAVGEPLGEFDLLTELGRGRRGRVYLARQPSLADRQVVLKLTPRADAEHHALARLQHTNIVPLYAAHDDQARRLRVLCMPFFGGATLAHALAALAGVPAAERTPTQVWDAVAAAPGNAPPFGAGPVAPPAWATDYVRVVVRVAEGLADALQFAHDHRLVHMDVKPSNVLLTAEGRPMLLDFHLARPPVPVVGPPPLWLGGTPAYQSPEQRAALDAIRTGRAVPAEVDGRSDVYSLGVLVYEALAGELPGERPVPLRARNHRVSRGLSDIVSRCLEPEARDRYPDAAALGGDLRRHLNDLPLRGVRNHSLAERWAKWRRRRPQGLILAAALTVLAGGGVVGSSQVSSRLGAARVALDEGNAELARGRFSDARGAFRRGLAVAEGIPFAGDLGAGLARGLRQSDQAVACGELHALAEGMRAVSAAEALPATDLARAERAGAELWARRTDLFALVKGDAPAAVRETARIDLLDVVIVWSHLRVQLAADPAAERRAAIDVLTEADRELGPWAGLYLELAALKRATGRPADAEADARRATDPPAASAWHHVAVGNHHLRRGALGPARVEFERAVARDPRSFWARLQLGRCDLAAGRLDDALLSFAVCTGLDPDNPAGHLHQALAHLRAGRRDRALADVERALALDPTSSQAKALRETLRRTP